MKTFTKQFMIDNSGCYSENELLATSFMKEDIITLKSIIDSDIPIKDKFWFLCKKVNTKEQNQYLSIQLAFCVLPIYENKYPNDLRQREAIEAAEKYLKGEITREELNSKRYAAAAADAAYAAAAYAAYAAAYAAAAADADAADAAYAAYAAAADAACKQNLQIILEDFCKNNHYES